MPSLSLTHSLSGSARALLCCGLLLGGTACQPSSVIPASYYAAQMEVAPVAIGFAPGETRPHPGAAVLAPVAASLPERTWVVFYAAGPLAVQRARAVSRLLRRPVELLAPPAAAATPADTGVLVFQVPQGIVYDACRGPGRRTVEDNWPGDDGTRALLLPPGCALGAALQAQVVDQSDLLRGQPLPPGAALPFAAAIERYYRRNDAGASGSGSEPPAARDSATTAPAPAAAGAEANPLIGPLTR